ncbi:uncharacterized protein LOC129748545 [Uranotaenia lowii]|uniref:uncharacterized protein LOC129748545 n=1 Tax=Uranotaenia lowii TaxID=190385 RepID=UPI0024787BEE|nr:uncharacterized protein LOC129748545 [Uranotaenia lowii]
MMHKSMFVVLSLALIASVSGSPNQDAFQTNVLLGIQRSLLAFERICLTTTGTGKAYKWLQNSLTTSIDCIGEDARSSMSVDDLCRDSNSTGSCLDPVIDAFAQCWPRDAKTNAFVLRKTRDNIVEMICSGELVKGEDTDAAKKMECSATVRKGLVQCKVPILFSDLTAQECRDMEVGQTCLQNLLATCEGVNLSKIINLLLFNIRTANNCDQSSGGELAENEI